MDRPFTHQKETQNPTPPPQSQNIFPPLESQPSSTKSNPFSQLTSWITKPLGNLHFKSRFSNGFSSKKGEYAFMVNNSVFGASPALFEEERTTMEGFIEKNEMIDGNDELFYENEADLVKDRDLIKEKGCESSSSLDFLSSETTGHEEHSHSSSEDSSSPPSLRWPIRKVQETDCSSSHGGDEGGDKAHSGGNELMNQPSRIPDMEMMKERFSKLLLGEDMSGCGNGVTTSLAISNAITNLCATLFGQLWRLEPLPTEKKTMWRREMEWLLCVSDHIVELMPSWQTFPDGSKLEVMTCRPRSDLYVNLPALRKLDNMVLEIMDGFENTEFWYVDQGIIANDADGSSSFRKILQRQEEKWWLPVPHVPLGGLNEHSRKQLQYKRDSTNQILKAAMAINGITLADMEIPQSYYESLPKNGKAGLGDTMYRYITSDQFNAESMLDCLDLSSEHQAIEIANRVEAAIVVWRKKPIGRTSSRSSWVLVKEFMIDAEKREMLVDRAENILLCLKQRFPGLTQTALDMSKIQYNKDVGKSILESYSRVLESMAFNIIARIDDLLYVDDVTKHSDQFSKVGVMGHKSVSIPFTMPHSISPYKSAFTTPRFSPANGSERSPFVTNGKIPSLTDYLTIKPASGSPKLVRKRSMVSSGRWEASSSKAGMLSLEQCMKETFSFPTPDPYV